MMVLTMAQQATNPMPDFMKYPPLAVYWQTWCGPTFSDFSMDRAPRYRCTGRSTSCPRRACVAAARVTMPSEHASGEMPRYRAGKNLPKSRISIERCSCILLKAAPCAMGASLRRLLQREHPMSFYDATVPAYIQILPSLSGLLTKAEAHCETKKIQPEVLLGSRLY